MVLGGEDRYSGARWGGQVYHCKNRIVIITKRCWDSLQEQTNFVQNISQIDVIFLVYRMSYIWREFSLAFAQLYPIGGHYYWRSIGTEFLSLQLLFLPLEVLPKGYHHR